MNYFRGYLIAEKQMILYRPITVIYMYEIFQLNTTIFKHNLSDGRNKK